MAGRAGGVHLEAQGALTWVFFGWKDHSGWQHFFASSNASCTASELTCGAHRAKGSSPIGRPHPCHSPSRMARPLLPSR